MNIGEPEPYRKIGGPATYPVFEYASRSANNATSLDGTIREGNGARPIYMYIYPFELGLRCLSRTVSMREEKCLEIFRPGRALVHEFLSITDTENGLTTRET